MLGDVVVVDVVLFVVLSLNEGRFVVEGRLSFVVVVDVGVVLSFTISLLSVLTRVTSS